MGRKKKELAPEDDFGAFADWRNERLAPYLDAVKQRTAAENDARAESSAVLYSYCCGETDKETLEASRKKVIAAMRKRHAAEKALNDARFRFTMDEFLDDKGSKR